MSLDFALKDVGRKWSQSFSYIKAISFTVAIAVFCIHTINGLGFLIFSGEINLYNYTTFDIFSQYFQFFVYSLIAIAVIWPIVINHSIITHKTQDLATMKAVGALHNRLNSFYMTELLIIDSIGLIIGIFLGFVGYLILFFIYSALGFEIVIFFDFFYTPILLSLTFISTILVNGYELRLISEKKYAKISTGDISSGYSAVGGLRMIPKIISKLGLKAKISISNLTRKKKGFYRILIMNALSMIILLTLTTGGIVVGNTIKGQISGAQWNGSILIGHLDVLDNYARRYEEFSDSSLNFNNTENLTDNKYLFNESFILMLESDVTGKYNGVNYWDKRLFIYEEAQEIRGIILKFQDDISNNSPYTIVGKDRRTNLPVIGIEFKEYINNWELIGTIDNNSASAIVGDTLGYNFFDSAIEQSVDLLNGTPRRYNVTGVLYDSFCAGSALYVPLDLLQEDFNLNKSINLAVLGVGVGIDRNELLKNITNAIEDAGLEDRLAVIDISEIFTENLNSINRLLFITYIIGVLLIITIVWSLIYYQKATFHERLRDFSVIRAIGGSNNFIKSVIFYEDLMILLISTGIALGFSLIFNLFLLGETTILPPISHVLILCVIIFVIIGSIVKLSVNILFREVSTRKQEYLKIFNN
ncbi:MAG: FtsX-like permease family protein [Promethearchaeota archaeon]